MNFCIGRCEIPNIQARQHVNGFTKMPNENEIQSTSSFESKKLKKDGKHDNSKNF